MLLINSGVLQSVPITAKRVSFYKKLSLAVSLAQNNIILLISIHDSDSITIILQKSIYLRSHPIIILFYLENLFIQSSLNLVSDPLL